MLLTSVPKIKVFCLQAPGYQHHKELKEINYLRTWTFSEGTFSRMCFQILIAFFIAIS